MRLAVTLGTVQAVLVTRQSISIPMLGRLHLEHMRDCGSGTEPRRTSSKPSFYYGLATLSTLTAKIFGR